MRVWLCVALLLGMFPVAQASDDWHYTLRPGDSLWKICLRFAQQPDLCWRQLASHNGLADPHALSPGDHLLVPLDWLKQKPIPAWLEAVTGEVTLYPALGGAPRPLRNGDTVQFGDAVETGADGSVRLHFADQSEVLLKPASLLVVNRYRRFLDQQGERTELRLERGQVRNRITPVASQEASFRVFTPGAVAAVRGTEYYLSVDGSATTRNEVIEGQVDMAARGTTREVQGGFATLAAVDEPPMAPVPLLPAPDVVVSPGHTGAVAVWPEQAGADHYWVEWYQQPDNVLLGQASLGGGHWQQTLPVGKYRLLVRAVDAHGLAGHEHWQDFAVTPPPAPQPEPREPTAWEPWAFVGAALLLLAL